MLAQYLDNAEWDLEFVRALDDKWQLGRVGELPEVAEDDWLWRGVGVGQGELDHMSARPLGELRKRDRVFEARVGCERDHNDPIPSHVNTLLEEQSPLLEREREELPDEVPGDHGGYPGVYHELEDMTEA
jgi:hypothetical protein